MTLRTSRKRWDERRKLTPAQEAANTRSFRIFRLRGLWHFAVILSPERRDAMQALIDAELVDLGAEPHTQRELKIHAARDLAYQREREREDLEAELPF
jgi:hypothetical protein